MSVVTVLTNPDGFFDDASDDPSLLWPGAVVFVVAVISAVASLPIVQLTQQALPEEASGFGAVALVSGLVGGFLVVFVLWVVYAALFHVIATVGFGGDGSISNLLAYVGWGYLPGILSAGVSLVVNYVVFSDVTPPSDPQAIQGFIRNLQNQPEFLVAGVVGIAVLLWQAFIWTFAVQHSHDVDLRSAAITVAIPVTLQAGWQLFNLL